MVVHACNPSTWKTEAGRFLSSRPAWSTEWVPGQPGLHRETLSRKAQIKKSLGEIVMQWWCTPVIPTLRRQRQADLRVRGQPGLQSGFQDSQGYIKKPCLGKTKQNKRLGNNVCILFFFTV